MKKKRSSATNDSSPKHKKQKGVTNDEAMHQFIDLLTDKVEEMQSIINSTSLTSDQSPDDPDFASQIDPNDVRDANTTSNSQASTKRFTNVNKGVAENSGQSSAGIMHRTKFNYAPDPAPNYLYGFTNNEFFAFIGSLDPVEYILVITVIAIIIGVELNVYEMQIVGGALVDIGVTLGNMVEQEVFQSARQNDIRSRQHDEAEQTDFDTLYNNIDALQAEIDALKKQLEENKS